jgi:hypothetical protein
MCIWVEIRCVDREEPYAEEGYETGDTKNVCWSNENSGPGELADETNESVLSIKREIEEQSRSAGWQRKKRGWVCPHCLKHTKNK